MKPWVLDHLEKLRAFECVARCGSLVKASRELGVTQPGLSRVVSSLEHASGKRLLDRSRLGCRLTPEGREILAFYEKLLPMARDLEQKIESRESVSGVLSVGTFESFASTWWPGFLRKFSVKYPGLKLALRTADGSRHRERLLHGSMDLVVEACPDENEKIISIRVGTDCFGAYFPKGALESKLLPWVYVPGAKSDEGKFISDLLREQGISPREAYELDTFSAVLEFVAAGIGVGVLPGRLARKVLKYGTIRRSPSIPKDFGTHSICASFLSENRNDPRIAATIRSLKEYLKS
jgi:DNA-binding transcriptional LysR family regulator